MAAIKITNDNFAYEHVVGTNIMGEHSSIHPNEIMFCPTINRQTIELDMMVTGKTIDTNRSFFSFHTPFELSSDCGLFRSSEDPGFKESQIVAGIGKDLQTNVRWEYPIRIGGFEALLLDHREKIPFGDSAYYQTDSSLGMVFDKYGTVCKSYGAQHTVLYNSLVRSTVTKVDRDTKFVFSSTGNAKQDLETVIQYIDSTDVSM